MSRNRKAILAAFLTAAMILFYAIGEQIRDYHRGISCSQPWHQVD